MELEAWSAPPANAALAANGGTVSASSSLTGYPASKVNDGDRKGGDPQFWADSSPGNFSSDWVEVDFSGSKTISEIDVVTLQDNLSSPIEPTLTQTFSSYGATAYDVQYWNGTAWIAVTGGNVTGNNKVWRQFAFTAVTTTKIRVVVKAVPDSYYSRIVELEAWTVSAGSTSANINWLVTDQLGTPRMIFDKTGSLATTKRHDYLPFGEEIFAGTGARSTAQGYSVADGVRQKFTQKERDNETSLDWFDSRYYSSLQGRFTSPDSYGGRLVNPQTLNLYSYVRNNPMKYVDPTGHFGQDPSKPKPDPNPYDPNCACYPYDDTLTTVTNDKKPPKNPSGSKEVAGEILEGLNALRQFSNEILLGPIGAKGSDYAAHGLGVAQRYGNQVIYGPLADKVDSVLSDPRVQLGLLVIPELDVEDVMEQGLVYRAGGNTPENFTPRLNEAFSTFSSPETVFANSSSTNAQVIDTSKLINLKAVSDASPEGHVSITPRAPSALRGWQQSRGTAATNPHPLTTELRNARVGSVKRPK